MGELIKSLAQQIINKHTLIEAHKNQLETTCKGTEVDLLCSIPGFGRYIAAVMMIEIEDISRFPSAKHLTSYFGIHPELKQSGDKAAFRMSKKGRPAPRAMLYMARLSAVRHDEHIKTIYHRQRKLGKCHYQAMGAVMSKLLRIVFGILKSNKPYDVATDKANICKNAERKQPETKQQEEIKNKRRYQQLSSQAPVSNRQSKERKVHLQSQTEQVGEVREQVNAPS
jgi:Transposase IS116/IS110/IS902 family.